MGRRNSVFEEIEEILISGADKVSLNTVIIEKPDIIEKQ